MVFRITGLATGFDTDSAVKQLMQAERVPLDKLSQKKQTVEWQRDAYRDINKTVTDFRNNKLFNFKLESTFNAKTVNITGDSSAVTATATADAIDGALTIKVDSLATAAKNHSDNTIANTDFDASKTLSSQSANLLHAGTMPSSYTFKINGTEITVDPTKETLNDVIKKINTQTNVTAFYDTASEKMSFIAKNTGTTNDVTGDGQYITFQDETGDLLSNVFQITGIGANSVAGTNASVTINGLSTARTSNTFDVNGVSITLKEAGGSEATIQQNTDTDKVFNAIKTFIDDYNNTLKSVQTKYNEDKNRDYPPLTDDQRSAMTDTQIEQWETKAKSGMLKNDPILDRINSDMRSDATAIVNTGDPNIRALSDIGIQTGDYSEQGKLYITDENKLRQAITDHPEAVKALFTGDAVDGGNGSEVGIAERMYSHLQVSLDNLVKKAGLADITYDDSTLTTQILDIGVQMNDLQDKLNEKEDNYYQRFSQMEETLSKYQAQGSQLLSAFGMAPSGQ